MQNIVNVIVCETEDDCADWPSDNLADAIGWLQAKLDSVPEEHRANVNLKIDGSTRYDCDYGRICISYRRRCSSFARKTQK